MHCVFINFVKLDPHSYTNVKCPQKLFRIVLSKFFFFTIISVSPLHFSIYVKLELPLINAGSLKQRKFQLNLTWEV